MRTDYDGPWKRALTKFLPHAFRLLFPRAFEKIAWARGFTFLDKELERAARNTQFPKLRVDKLVRVYLIGGDELWILIHIEVQSQRDPKFGLRMFVYNNRLYEQYGKPIASFGVLADDVLTWRPDRYERDILDTHVEIRFPIVKIKDFESRIEELENSDNIFALIILAQLRTKASHNDAQRRFEFKRHLLELAYNSGFSKDDVREVLWVIDTLMALPDTLDKQMEPVWEALEMKSKLEILPYWERKGIEKGAVRNAREFVIDALRSHFGKVPAETKAALEVISDPKRLKVLHKMAIKSPSFDDFKKALAK